MAVAAASVSVSPVADAASAPRGFDRRAISFLSIAHGFNDMNQSVVPAVLPFLIAQRDLSYAAAGTLVLTLTIASSVVQPLFGYITDKHSMPWLVPGGMVAAMIGTVLLGLAPTYTMLILATLLMGLGSASFHPEAVRYANLVSGERRGTGMGFFALGGNLGFASGPIFVTPAILLFGLHGIGLIVIPGILFALALSFLEMRRLTTYRTAPKKFANRAERDDRWGAFSMLTTTIILRSVVFFGIMTFTPLFFIGVLGIDKAAANAILAAVLVSGALGTVFGGWLGDRFDRRMIVNVSLTLGTCIAASILGATSAHAPVAVFVPLFMLMSFVYQWSSSVTVVLGQDYLPTRIGTASGVTFGLATSIGGLGAPLMGSLADSHGLITVIYAIGATALVALAFALFLPPVRTGSTT